MKRFIVALPILMLVVVAPSLFMAGAPTSTPSANAQTTTFVSTKAAFSYFMLTETSRIKTSRDTLLSSLALSEDEKAGLKKIALDEQTKLRDLYNQTQAIAKDRTKPIQQKRSEIASTSYNANVAQVLENSDGAIASLLGSTRAAEFGKKLEAWWTDERSAIASLKSEPVAPMADATRCYMFATQYATEGSYDIALPDQYVKFANRGWEPRPSQYYNPPYTVDLNRDPYWVYGVIVWDVGPWNIDDNYWDSATGFNPRRFGSDIPICWSEAEYAYWYGYNNGQDQFGRTVTVPTSIDLSFAVAADLGLEYLQNDWMYIYVSDLP